MNVTSMYVFGAFRIIIHEYSNLLTIYQTQIYLIKNNFKLSFCKNIGKLNYFANHDENE